MPTVRPERGEHRHVAAVFKVLEAHARGEESGRGKEAAQQITHTITRRSIMSSLTVFRVIAPQRGTPCWFRRRSALAAGKLQCGPLVWKQAWPLLAPPPGPTIGRKRRARRARGRRIEARQALGHGHWFRVKLDSASGFRSKPIGPTTRIFNVDIPTCIDEVDSFLDPSLGGPWELADW